MEIPSLLANQFETFIAGAFMVIAFVGWVINLINQNQPAGQQKRRAQRPRPQAGNGQRKNSREEIDKFLDRSRQMKRRAPAETAPTSKGVEVVQRRSPPAKKARPAPQGRRTKRQIWEEQVGQAENRPKPEPPRRQQRPASQPQQTPEPVSIRPGEALSERHLQHLKSKIESGAPLTHIEEIVAQDLGARVNAAVTDHLGAFRVADPSSPGEQSMMSTTAEPPSRARHLAQMLRSKSGMRTAILLGEIMSKPRALR